METKRQPFLRTAKYYETDQMGVIHHSNYIRWFEEARLDLMNKMGFSYDKMEKVGIISPVISISCEYKSAVKFNDTVAVIPKIEFFNGVRMTVTYEVIDYKSNELRATGQSKHCFLSKETLKPVKMKQDFKEVYELFLSITEGI
ncbi:MAG: thioesterase family protein [Firmicutes bacterium]|nr:thioesterase family protein [Bacillota bacterium]MDD4262910.1 thioesterase family protein [Bacillota bacterium]MDD4693055.1 thioesterase family protein [Bacillota bacterium]